MDGGRVHHERLYKSSAIVTAVFRPLHPDPNCIGQSSSLLLPAIFNPHWFDHLLCTHRPFTITLNGVWGQNKKHPIIWHICIKSFGAYLPSLKLSQRCLGYQWRHDDIGSIQVTTLTILSDRNVEYKICFPWGTDAIFHWDWKHALSSNRGAPRLSYSDSESF